MRRLVFLTLSWLLSVSFLQAQEKITISASGREEVTADLAQLSFYISYKAGTQAEANDSTQTNTLRLIRLLNGEGIAKEAIQLNEIKVEKNEVERQEDITLDTADSAPEREKITFTASQRLTVRMVAVPAFIERVMSAYRHMNASGIDVDLDYLLSDSASKAADDRVYLKVLENGWERARMLAKAGGMKELKLLSIVGRTDEMRESNKRIEARLLATADHAYGNAILSHAVNSSSLPKMSVGTEFTLVFSTAGK